MVPRSLISVGRVFLTRAPLVCLAGFLAIGSAAAQETTGTPGSPSATTTVDGNYLPNPPPAFGGEIGLDAKDSKSWWPPSIVPPKGAPNILLIMTDDQGYGISGTFGGVIPTPSMDRIAEMGLRYTAFHSTALCSPTLGRRSSPGEIIIPSASGSSPSRPPAIRATTLSSASTTPRSARF